MPYILIMLFQIAAYPYSIGYSVLADALASSIAQASMINYAGNIVVASSSSVTFACNELGGNLDSRMTASLWDGKSAKVWPIAGFTYFVIRLKAHVGDCDRRKVAMKYLYDFYTSPTVSVIAQSLGFGVIPNTISTFILNKLVLSAQCSNGEYALAEYREQIVPIASSEDFTSTVQTFTGAFNTINATLTFSINGSESSVDVWSRYSSAPHLSPGAFTLFTCAKERQSYYEVEAMKDVYSSGFANVAIAILYKLSTLQTAGVTLQVTADILGGIYSGTIKYWNDTAIQTANPHAKSYLPYSRIHVVSRAGANDDTSALFIRYLALNSATFRSKYNLASDPGRATVNFASFIDSNYLEQATSNTLLDLAVLIQEGSVGYYLYVTAPTSPIASLCTTTNYSSHVTVKGFGEACVDESTTVTGATYSSFDLMVSSSPECYPLGGTVDYSVLTTPSADSEVFSRVQFSSWLYQTATAVSPSLVFAVSSTSSTDRAATFSKVCDISTANSVESQLGYTYCDYVVCGDTDYTQLVSGCSASTTARTVSYQLSEDKSCRDNNPLYPPPSSADIDCAYVPSTAGVAVYGYVVCALGFCFCSYVLWMTIINRNEKLIKRSQPLFLYIYLVGCIMMNCTVLVFVGENTTSLCRLRPILLNLSSTVMFAPLIMKLRRVQLLLCNKTLRKQVITNFTVLVMCCALLFVDVILLALWGSINDMAPVVVSQSYAHALSPVDNVICNSGLSRTPFEAVMLTYKAILLAYGTYLVSGTHICLLLPARILLS
jgi:ABC-type phosphate transport system substrate-binding protein